MKGFELQSVTLAQWRAAGADARAVILDALLERLPEGYVVAQHTGMQPAAVPQLIHRQTQVMFHVVWGGPLTVGMTDARKQAALDAWWGPGEDHEWGAPPDFEREPPRQVVVRGFLLAEAPLVDAQLVRLGAKTGRVRQETLDEVALVLASAGWRLPTVDEHEYALRGGDDAPPRKPSEADEAHPLSFLELGQSLELCGGGVVRGQGPLSRRRSATYWWPELVWPGSKRLGRRELAFVRPAANLP